MYAVPRTSELVQAPSVKALALITRIAIRRRFLYVVIICFRPGVPDIVVDGFRSMLAGQFLFGR